MSKSLLAVNARRVRVTLTIDSTAPMTLMRSPEWWEQLINHAALLERGLTVDVEEVCSAEIQHPRGRVSRRRR